MMKKKAPNKQFFEAPTAGNGATCKSCAHCPWMEMNDLQDILVALRDGRNEILVPKEISYDDGIGIFEGAHDGYVKSHGLTHVRKLKLLKMASP